MSHDEPDASVCHEILPANQSAARSWSNGGHAYDRISHQIADAIEHAIDRLSPATSRGAASSKSRLTLLATLITRMR